jgi:endo-1,4-beta-D-glucanase Y
MSKIVSACLLALTMFIVTPAAAVHKSCQSVDWPLWTLFRQHFVLESGRVLDPTTKVQQSTSEGQSYGMFFALVANDQAAFDKIWRWAVDNLGQGDLSKRLPAWHWGQSEDGSWKVLDENSASDADLWFAYTLLEAGRLWNRPDYTRSAQAMLVLVEAEEMITLPQFGLMLLPGKTGFSKGDDLWRLNPSYLPISLLRRLELEAPSGPWGALAANTAKMMAEVAPKGLMPDWLAYRAVADGKAEFTADPDKGPVGSYDAIRNYLWAGMTPMSDPLFQDVMQSLDGMVALTRERGAPPESVDTVSGAAKGEGPFGFSAALLPYFKATNASTLVDQQKVRVQTLLRQNLESQATPPSYYDFVLSLFGLGWLDQYYVFRPDGTLSLPWEKACLGITAN